MRNARVNYAVVGGFVLGMLAVLVAMVALLAGRTGATDRYTTHFANVTGVKYGTKVSFEGFVVGQVEDIRPERDGGQVNFLVRLAIRRGWPIPVDSRARVTASGLLSAPIVDIKGGAESRMLPPGSEIAGGVNANLFALMNDMAGQVNDLNQTGLKPLLQTLNDHAERLGGLLDRGAPQLLADMLAISGDLAEKTPRITAQVEQVTSTLSGKVVTDLNARRMAKSIENVEHLTEGLRGSRRKLDATLAVVNHVVAGNSATVDASLKDLRYTLQTVARSIDSVTNNLEGATRNLDEFSRQLRDNPAVLIGGRHTEDGPKDHP